MWVSRGLNPRTREVLATFGRARDIVIVEHPLLDGRTVWAEDAAPEAAAEPEPAEEPAEASEGPEDETADEEPAEADDKPE